MIFSLRSFPEGTRATISGNDIMLYGADGREWARIVERDGEITPFPTDDIPEKYKPALKEICILAEKSV